MSASRLRQARQGEKKKQPAACFASVQPVLAHLQIQAATRVQLTHSKRTGECTMRAQNVLHVQHAQFALHAGRH